MQGLDTVIRNRMADFIWLPTESDPNEFEWVLMGSGFLNLDESPNAQTETRAYINDASATQIVRGYEVEFPFTADMIANMRAVMALYNVGRNQLQGIDAEFDYCRVELFKPEISPGVFPARRFRVAVDIADTTGAGTEIMEMSGALRGVGDFVDGSFDTDTNEFTAFAS